MQRALGPFTISAIGFGCMNVSHGYLPRPDKAASIKVLNAALDAGYTHLDTAALYGFGANEEIVGEAVMHRRDEFVLASKCGLFRGPDGNRAIDGRPASIKAMCDAALARLRTEVIDLYYLHRLDRSVPIEESTGALAELVAAGKVRSIGLSEVSAATLRRAHAVHPIAAVQTEYSLWTRNPEIALLDACRELGTTFVAFSPLARGFLTGKLRDVSGLLSGDLRSAMPRFKAGTYAENLKLLDGMEEVAAEVGCTMAQLALAWMLAKGEHIVPIPGTTRIDHLKENFGAAQVRLPEHAVARLDSFINQHTVQGARYDAANQSDVDTEEFV
ncbi:MAG: aldo/keto reductase [Rhodospirillaceae bacterium]|nr:aldo/keto reductase [Rhodospirillaceae bacterium]